MLIKKKISLLMIMVIERSYNLIITERYYFLVLEVNVKKKKVNLIEQGELTLILVIIFT
jgi:hypothetical protein